MLKLDLSILDEMGIKIDEGDKEAFNEHVLATLEERVGLAITELLDDEELAELLQVQEAGDDKATEAWIVKHVPDYKDVIQDEYDILLGEIVANDGKF